MSEYTKEPWRTDADAGFPSDIHCAITGALIASTHSNGTVSDANANARRIVACVNACAGISTAALEEAAVSRQRVSEMLLCQRDELATILRQVRTDMEAKDVLFPWWEIIDAAIAKVTRIDPAVVFAR